MSDVAVRDPRTPAQILMAQVRSPEFKEQVAMVLTETTPPSRFVRSTATALLQNPKLAELEHDSLFASLFKAAADGLLPDGREAAIVAHGNKATYLPMIGGVIKIAGEHGWSMTTRVVYANDDFDYELGLNERIEHKPAAGDRGDRVYAYAIARHRDGRPPLVEVMDAAEIEKVRSVSRAASKGPWVDWPDRMWEKSIGHRLFKRLPLDPGDKRVARIALDAEDLGPAASAELLYGPGGSTFAAREIEQATDSSQGATEGGPEASADTSQQAAVGEAASGDEPATDGTPSAAPGAEPPAPPDAPGFQIPDAVLDQAAAHVVKHNDAKSAWNGRTLASIAEDQEYGAKWLAWAAGSDGDLYLDEATVAAVRLLVEHRHPEIWSEVTA